MAMQDWADLPEDVLSSILSNLFLIDRHSFSLTCKSWNRASEHSPFRHSPCLMYFRNTTRSWDLFQHNASFSLSLPEHVNNADIRCVKYGWMLMSSSNLSMFFFDPFNNRTIHLPKADSAYSAFCFFHPPTSPRCFVIGISSLVCANDAKIGVIEQGKWRRIDYHTKSKFDLMSACTPVLHRGLLHCLDMEGNVATFDVNNRDSPYSWKVTTRCLSPTRLRKKIQKQYLVKVNDEAGSLLAVMVTHEEMKVHVYRLVYEPRVMRWDPVEDLGDKVLFLSYTASFAATAPWRSMANRIYFPKKDGEGGFVYYCMKTRKYHSCSSSDYSSKKVYGLRDLNSATWIVATPTDHPDQIPSNLTWCSNVDHVS